MSDSEARLAAALDDPEFRKAFWDHYYGEWNMPYAVKKFLAADPTLAADLALAEAVRRLWNGYLDDLASGASQRTADRHVRECVADAMVDAGLVPAEINEEGGRA